MSDFSKFSPAQWKERALGAEKDYSDATVEIVDLRAKVARLSAELAAEKERSDNALGKVNGNWAATQRELAAERQRAERYRVALEYLLDHWSEKAAHAMARAALEQKP